VERGITHVVNASQLSNCYTDKFVYHTVDVPDVDTADISKFFSSTNDFIHNAILKGGVVLINCFGGVSRGPTLAIAYLVEKRNKSLQEAYDIVKSLRTCTQINLGFLSLLQNHYGQKLSPY